MSLLEMENREARESAVITGDQYPTNMTNPPRPTSFLPLSLESHRRIFYRSSTDPFKQETLWASIKTFGEVHAKSEYTYEVTTQGN